MMIEKKNVVITGFLLLLSLPVFAAPYIHIGSMYDYLDDGKSTLLKRVRNSGTSTAFVKVAVYEIIFGADDKQEEIPVDTSLLIGGNLNGLVASPPRLIVPVNGVQATRLLYMGSREAERYFRVRFTPVLPDKEDEFGAADADVEASKSEMSAGVNVLTGFGSVVIVRPQQRKYDTLLQDEPLNYSVHNKGNSTVVLDVFYDCAMELKQCGSPGKYHVRPGGSKTFDKVAGRSYKFELIEGDSKKKVQFGQLATP